MSDHAATRLLDHPARAGALGAAVGAVVAALLVLAGLPARPHPAAPPAPSPDAAARFLAAWRAHLLGSWSVQEVGQRTTSTGATIRFQVHQAQRPPDSVEIGGNTVSARRGSTLIACATPLGSRRAVCREAPAPRTWEADAAAELAVLESAVSGPRSEYVVAALGGGCFALTLRDPRYQPPANTAVRFGRHATYCLDARTAALRSTTVDLGTSVDTTTSVELHAPATDADLALPGGAVYER